MLQDHNMQKRAWHASTKGNEQNSLTKLEPKMHRKDGSLNEMASDMNGFMASQGNKQ